MTKLLIIGAGGHGRVVADCAQAMNKWQEIAFLDDSFPKRNTNLAWPIIGAINSWQEYRENYQFIVAIGDNKARLCLLEKLQQAHYQITNIIHPSAVISPHTAFGDGNVIFANAVINPGVNMGFGNIINTSATIDHDCKLANAIHISPGVNVAGTVTIESLAWLGVGASVIQGIHIAENTQIGGGACVIENTQSNSLYVGVPAKKIKDI